jgi:YggT family protein
VVLGFVVSFINALAFALSAAILVRVVQSWIPQLRLPFGVGEFAWNVSEPILGPIRRALPLAGGIDFSPLIALLAIQFGERALLELLARAV